MSHRKPSLDTVETLAARFSLPRRTIVREVMSSRLPYVSIAGNWRFRQRDVELWLQRTGSLPRLTLIRGGLTADYEGSASAGVSATNESSL